MRYMKKIFSERISVRKVSNRHNLSITSYLTIIGLGIWLGASYNTSLGAYISEYTDEPMNLNLTILDDRNRVKRVRFELSEFVAALVAN